MTNFIAISWPIETKHKLQNVLPGSAVVGKHVDGKTYIKTELNLYYDSGEFINVLSDLIKKHEVNLVISDWGSGYYFADKLMAKVKDGFDSKPSIIKVMFTGTINPTAEMDMGGVEALLKISKEMVEHDLKQRIYTHRFVPLNDSGFMYDDDRLKIKFAYLLAHAGLIFNQGFTHVPITTTLEKPGSSKQIKRNDVDGEPEIPAEIHAIDVEKFVGDEDVALIIQQRTGVFITAQTGGVSCNHPVTEGFVLSLGGFSPPDACSYGCQSLNTSSEMRKEYADDFDGFVERMTSDWTYQIRFDYDRIDQLQESWVPVTVKGNLDTIDPFYLDHKGIFVQGNCD